MRVNCRACSSSALARSISSSSRVPGRCSLAMPRIIALRRPTGKTCDECLQEAVCLMAVHDAVIDGQRDIAPWPDHHAVDATFLHHDGPLLELSDPQDSRLRLVDDDGCGNEAAAHAMVRDGEGSPTDISGNETPLPSTGNEVVQTLRRPEEIKRLHVAENGHDQATCLQRRSHSNVNGIEDFQSAVGPTAVGLGHGAN